jgi:signal transduction histidine kinase
MKVLSKPSLNSKNTLPFVSNDRAIAPIHQLSKICCALSLGAALFFFLDVFIYRYIKNPQLYLQWLDGILIVLALLMMATAAICGFRIVRQAKIEARKNTELLQEAKRRASEIAALYDTSQDISIQHHLPMILQNIVDRAQSLLNTAGGAIFLLDKAQHDFQIAVEIGVGMPIGTHLPLHEGLGGRVFQTKQPLIVNDYQRWPERATALKQLPIGATICVPMMRRGELIGVLGVHEVAGTTREYTQAEARLLSVFANNAAGAVENARLLDALKESEERFRIAAGCASDIVYDWNLSDDRVEYFGAAYENSKTVAKSMPGTRQEYFKRIHPEDCGRVQLAIADHLESDKPFSEEYRILDVNNAYINVSDRGTAIRNPRGKPIKLIGAISNITERKQAEQMKTDFVSFVTHQLRTPLSGVKWMLELAMDGAENLEGMRTYIQDARISTDRLIGLVNDLLDISRLERGKLEITYSQADLVDLTQCVVKEIAPLILEKKLSISIQADENLTPLSSDPQLLRQIVLNLTSNAMKYTPTGGDITIRIHPEVQRICWEIQDTGIGIPKGDMAKLFDKFYRAGNVLAVETEGTGLGLYLVRLIVERLGGDVSFESEEGVGSTFRFVLPLQPERI